jgi:hypothetical protein
MVKTKPKTAEEILSKVDDEKKQIAEKIRALVKNTVPDASEIVRRGRLTYTLNGKDFAAIRLTKQHVDLLYKHGESLSSKHIKGKGSASDPKHIEVFTLKGFEEAEARRLLKEEVATVLAL